MSWVVEYSDEFGEWWESLAEGEQESVAVSVGLLELKGPNLPFPYSSGVTRSRYGHMRELRVQNAGEPYRVLYAFDPRRTAILLIGGNKKGNDRWYEEFVPIADKIYHKHMMALAREK